MREDAGGLRSIPSRLSWTRTDGLESASAEQSVSREICEEERELRRAQHRSKISKRVDKQKLITSDVVPPLMKRDFADRDIKTLHLQTTFTSPDDSPGIQTSSSFSGAPHAKASACPILPRVRGIRSPFSTFTNPSYTRQTHIQDARLKPRIREARRSRPRRP